MSHYSARFHWTFRFKILYKKLRKLYAEVLISSCRTVFQFVNFDGLNFLTAPVSFNQPNYSNHSNKNSDWPILACFMRV